MCHNKVECLIFTIFFFLILGVMIAVPLLVSYMHNNDIGYNDDEFQHGYEQGALHILLYYKATGEWPSHYWRHTYLKEDLQNENDILKTLERVEGN